MEREGGNRERIRKCRESISLHFLIFSPFPLQFLARSLFHLHFLASSPFSRRPPAASFATLHSFNLLWLFHSHNIGEPSYITLPCTLAHFCIITFSHCLADQTYSGCLLSDIALARTCPSLLPSGHFYFFVIVIWIIPSLQAEKALHRLKKFYTCWKKVLHGLSKCPVLISIGIVVPPTRCRYLQHTPYHVQ